MPQFTDPSPELRSPCSSENGNAQPLLIIGPMWISMWLKQHSHWVEELDYRFVHAQDLTKPSHPLSSFFLKELGLSLVQAVLMEHSYPTFGIVMQHICGWKLVYSADSRPSQVLAAVGKNATMLIHEATFDAPFQQKVHSPLHTCHSFILSIGLSVLPFAFLHTLWDVFLIGYADGMSRLWQTDTAPWRKLSPLESGWTQSSLCSHTLVIGLRVGSSPIFGLPPS